jgi:hypothetical protein
MSPVVPQAGTPPQKQTTYNGVGYQVTPVPGGGAILMFATPAEVIAFPLDSAAREAIGKALLAPSVVVPNGNGSGPG